MVDNVFLTIIVQDFGPFYWDSLKNISFVRENLCEIFPLEFF